MAIQEACALWIEQRIREELDRQEETGNSLREIGRIVSAEVIKLFETKVNQNTIYSKVQRITSGANASPDEIPTTPSDSAKIKQIKRPAKDGTMRGGPLPGAGRKMKTSDANTSPEEIFNFPNFPNDSLDDILISSNDSDEDVDIFATKPVAKGHEGVPEKSEQAYSAEQKRDSLKISHAMQFAMIAISQLERIKKNDPNKEMAFNEVREYMEQNR